MRRESAPQTGLGLTYAVLAIGSVIMLTPLAWMVLTSLKSFDEVIETLTGFLCFGGLN